MNNLNFFTREQTCQIFKGYYLKDFTFKIN